ncbi:MAG: hypothetical protein PVSMB6_08850 [Steroidobacteraceae bacterium]
MFLLGAAASPAAHAVAVTTYGAGLKSCRNYLEVREGNAAEQVPFIDWLSGYFSGANKTSNHRNNTLGLSDLGAALSWLDDYCRARPRAPFAQAASMLLLGAKPGPTAHAIEVTTYGSADKSCGTYLEAREQQELAYWMEFTDWLGGYLSGVNAMSLGTNSILGSTELPDAVAWLDRYCGAHSVAPFGAAVEALVAANHRDRETPSWKSASAAPAVPASATR